MRRNSPFRSFALLSGVSCCETVIFAADITNQCDEKTPECSQCVRSGKSCPGPLQGTLFIDVVDGQLQSKDVRGMSLVRAH